MTVKVVGAGLAGLICAALTPNAEVFESNARREMQHKALLRFRSDAIGRALGVPFRKVRVNKAIWSHDEEVAPSPRVANLYSRKVLQNELRDRSIWNVEPVDRYIAPSDLYNILVARCEGRIHWERPIHNGDLSWWRGEGAAIISTIPMPSLLSMAEFDPPSPLPQFSFAGIYVSRYTIHGADLFQTVYFPDAETSVYRASITGDLLIVESVRRQMDGVELRAVLRAFGLVEEDIEPHDNGFPHRQTYGKIAPIPDRWRKAILYSLTTERGIFSLGRFATWKNILLDDVYGDMMKIRELMTLSHYDKLKGAAA